MTKDETDHALMLRVAQKDIAAYRELVGRHLSFCVRFAERMLGNRHDAEDIAQETCFKIWNEAERWQPKAKFSTWLYRVIFNACIDYKRKRMPCGAVEMEEIIDDTETADVTMVKMEDSKKVQQALQRIPERQRAALILSYYEEVSNQQAAETMNLQLGAFQQLLFRARQGVKEQLLSSRDYREKKNG